MNTRSGFDFERLADIVAKSKQKETETAIVYEDFQFKAKREEIELLGRRQFFKLRNLWSCAIILWITIIISFNIFLSWQIGVGHWDFEKYSWFLGGLVAQNIGQIIGMGYLVIKFLYPRPPHDDELSTQDYAVMDKTQ